MFEVYGSPSEFFRLWDVVVKIGSKYYSIVSFKIDTPKENLTVNGAPRRFHSLEWDTFSWGGAYTHYSVDELLDDFPNWRDEIEKSLLLRIL